ncbi:BrnA antitoxin family protein [Salinibacter sp.]|uniref:BrnA antitoxin family protein n=1 Tax=Salinibacter sp. TaxID=2065818 RepID=UPI0021E79624|nr:BrnA antitoxin family protein [Salinibacter sp.]
MSESHTVRKSQDEIQRDLAEGADRTDWDRLREMTDADIERAVRDDPDAALLDEEWFRAALEVRPSGWPRPSTHRGARVVRPSGEKEQISIRLDKEVLKHFRAEGEGYQTRINDVLRAYVLVQRMKEGEEPSERDSSAFR